MLLPDYRWRWWAGCVATSAAVDVRVLSYAGMEIAVKSKLRPDTNIPFTPVKPSHTPICTSTTTSYLSNLPCSGCQNHPYIVTHLVLPCSART